ncbi:MAG: hypothetical protein Q8Q04_01205 [archaeon]|nr:hypothetical protein [archaeon]
MAIKRSYFVFLQALLITIVVFIVGFYIGISVEAGRTAQVNNYFTQSETSLVDILALNKLVGSGLLTCQDLIESNRVLLDRVYNEASELDQYEESGKLTDSLKTLHQKYDVLRTYLWINSIEIKRECVENFPTIVYIYNHDEKDLMKKAEQNVWSKLLLEVKNENKEVHLIPIAQDSNLESLNLLIKNYGIKSFPAVIVNEKDVFYEFPTKEEILSLINNSSQ